MLEILHNSMPPLLEIGWRRLGSYASFNLQFHAIFIQCFQFCKHYQSYADFSKLLKLTDLTDFIQNLKIKQQLLYCKNSMDTKNEGMSILLEVVVLSSVIRFTIMRVFTCSIICADFAVSVALLFLQ